MSINIPNINITSGLPLHTQATVAPLKQGGFVAVWQGADAEGGGIWARIFDGFGNPLGQAFVVNHQITKKDQLNPTVTVLEDGRFLVAWDDASELDQTDPFGITVRGRFFTTDGTATGIVGSPEFLISNYGANTATTTVYEQSQPELASLKSGGYVAAYVEKYHYKAVGLEYSAERVAVRIVSPSGVPTDVAITGQGAGASLSPVDPSISVLSTGDLIVTWTERSLFEHSSYGEQVKMARVSPLGIIKKIETANPVAYDGNQNQSVVTALAPTSAYPNGGWVVVWHTDYVNGGDVMAQVYNDDGNLRGNAFRVHSADNARQSDPVVVALPNGGFVVAWVDNRGSASGTAQDIRAQVYNADLTRNGGEFVVHDVMTSNQVLPSMTVLKDGRILIGWSNSGDGSGSGYTLKAAYLDFRQGKITLVGTDQHDTYYGSNFHDQGDSIHGGSGNDTLGGGNGDDTLNGGAHDDVLYGDSGFDSLVGGTGTDTADYRHSRFDGVLINLETGARSGEATGDTYDSIEIFIGTNHSDTISGGGNAREVSDTFKGAGGDDTLIGGGGNDLLDGGDQNDFLDGGRADDKLYGGAGDDLMYGGEGIGADHFNGGGGENDRVLYSQNASSGIVLDLNDTSGASNTGEAYFDTFVGIIGWEGTNKNDTLTGNNDYNRLAGNDGNDIINGGGGNDWLHGGGDNDKIYGGDDELGDYLNGGWGVDTLIGGVGADTFDGGGTGYYDYVTYENSKAGIKIDFTVVNGHTGDAAGDTYAFINEITGTNHNDTLIGADGNTGDPSSGWNIFHGGGGNDIIRGGHGYGIFTGGAGNDTITGGMHEDTLYGNEGADELNGGGGNDTYYIDNLDKVVDGGGIADTAYITTSGPIGFKYDLTSTGIDIAIVQNDLANVWVIASAGGTKITGNDLANTLQGAAGADTLTGGLGSDVYIVTSSNDLVVETSNAGLAGIDKVIASGVTSYTLTANVENLEAAAGTFNIDLYGNELGNTIIGNDGVNTIDGGSNNDSLDGGRGNDSLVGGIGDDTLQGGLGNDTMVGGAGADTYYVSHSHDFIEENFGQGHDIVYTTSSYKLSDNLEDLSVLSADSENPINLTGNDIKNTITGNNGVNSIDGAGGDDKLIGGGGDDILRGGSGIDTLVGGDQNDTYYVDREDDKITEGNGANSGHDTVYTTSSYTLSDNVEDLSADGLNSTTDINLTGNDLGNKITGNDGANSLDGGVGNDILIGGGGDDILQGGFGDDRMVGGKGDDVYHVNSIFDKVEENEGEGRDKVLTGTTHTLGDNVEDLAVSSAGSTHSVNLTGNRLDNELTGNDGTNVLNGLDGNDTINGGGGTDTLNGDNGNDTLNGGSGNDMLNGGANDDELDGGDDDDQLNGGLGNDTLDGGEGIDVMTGGAGDDTYYVRNPGDTIIEDADPSGGTNDVAHIYRASFVLEDSIGIEEIRVGSSVNFDVSITGNVRANTIVGGRAKDTLTGDGGNDSLSGGLGNDTLHGGADNDILDGGENDDSLDGGTGSDVLYGGGGHDILDGGEGGLDRFKGGSGNDTYYLRNAGDVIEFDQGGDQGLDTVYVLSRNIGDGSPAAIRAYVDNLRNNGIEIIYVNGVLYEAGGWDNDVYNVDRPDFEIIESTDRSGGFDRANIFIPSYVLDDTIGVEVLAVGDTVGFDVSITGNKFENTIIGGIGNDSLIGNAGEDSITGGVGNDTLLGGEDNDSIEGGANDDVLDGGAGADKLYGGDGDDTYHIDLDDDVFETADGGADDTIIATVEGTYTLAAHIEHGKADEQAGAVNLNGNEVDNELTGNSASNTLDGKEGNDTLKGEAGTDLLEGGSGNDVLEGGTGNDTLNGGADDDILHGGGDDDSLDGGENQDELNGGLGRDTLNGGTGIDILNGGDDDDVLNGGDDDDVLDGGLGSDILIGGDGDDILNGGFVVVDGEMVGDGVADTLHAGAGNDTYYLLDADDVIDFHDQVDEGNNDRVYMLSKNFLLPDGSTVDWDAIRDYAITLWEYGIETVYVDGVEYDGAMGGLDDEYFIHTGDEDIDEDEPNPEFGGTDTAYIFLDASGDNHYTLSDDDYIEILKVGDGVTEGIGITGNSSDNTIIGGVMDDTLSGAGGNDTILDGDGADELNGDAGDDTLDGGAGNDTLNGGADNDELDGGNDDDRLFGGDGSDLLIGGDGNDILDGGVGGPDTLRGGMGNDVYYLWNREDEIETDEGGEADEAWVLSANIGDEGTPATEEQIRAYVQGLWAKGIENVYVDEILYEPTGDEAPTGVGLSVSFVDELAPTGSIVGRLSQLGGAPGASYTYTLVEDDRFYLDGEFLMVKNGILIDFEDVNFYELWVTVSMNGGPPSEAFRVPLNVLDLEIENAEGGDATNDLIKGGSEGDVLNGAGGNDTLFGSAGTDRLIGGTGSDKFVFDTRPGSSNIDTIVDFRVSDRDEIHLARSMYRIGDLGQLSSEAFAIGSEATDEFQRVLYDADFGWLRVDVDGSGEEEAVIVANIGSDLDLKNTHFFIV
jgi:Ca2+-binding RTX toxin-like protein